MARVIEVNDLETLAGYRMTWNALLDETPGASFFHTFDWLVAFCQHFGETHKLRVLVVEAAGSPIGIVPLVVRTEQRRHGKVRVLTYPLDGWGMRYSPIGGAQAATLALAMRHLAGSARDWDYVEFPCVDHEGADRGRTLRALQSAGLPAKAESNKSSLLIDLPSDWEEYLSSRKSKTRHEIRRHIRRVEGLNGFEYIRHRPAPLREGDGDPAWDLFEECVSVAQESWQARDSVGNTLGHERYQGFLRDCHEAAARQGMVDMNILRAGGQAIAFNYNYRYGGEVFALRTGYRKDCSQVGAGVGLTYLTLRDGIERGDHQLELGEGTQSYKRRLSTGVTKNWRITHTPITSWRSQAVRLGRWIRSRRNVAS